MEVLMRKRIIGVFILLCMTTVVSSCNKNKEAIQETQSVQMQETAIETAHTPKLKTEQLSNPYFTAYTTFLNDLYENKKLDEELEFYVKDIDYNSIPELILRKNGVVLSVYTYDGAVEEVGSHDFGSGTSRFLSSDDSTYPGIFCFSVGGGYEWYSYITIEDSKLIIEELWNKDFSGISKELGKKRGTIEETSKNKKLIKESKKAYKRNNDIGFKKVLEDNTTNIKKILDDSDDITEEYKEKLYNNPIDEYYLPKIYSWDASQAEIRSAQDTYRAVWSSEFKHLMKWLRKKCVYQEDKKNIKEMEKSVEENINSSLEVITIELLDVYEVNPDSSKNKDNEARSWYWGNGTRSRLNQIAGEMYRDASMKIINLTGGTGEMEYPFRDIDYSKISSEGGDTFYYIE